MKQAHFKGTADTTHTKSIIMSATLILWSLWLFFYMYVAEVQFAGVAKKWVSENWEHAKHILERVLIQFLPAFCFLPELC